MSWIEPAAVTFWAWRGALALWVRSRVWPPFLLLAAAQLSVAGILLLFHHPLLVRFVAPVIATLGGEAATHYPGHLYELPAIYRLAEAPVTALVASIALAAGTVRMAEALGSQRAEKAWRTALRRAPHLLLLGVVMAGLERATFAAHEAIPLEIRFQSTMVRMGLLGSRLLVSILFQWLLAYGLAFVVLRGRRAWSAIGHSIRLALVQPLPTLLVVAVPAALLFPVGVAIEELNLAEEGVSPELVVMVLCARIVLEFGLVFLRTGALTRIFLWRTEAK